MLRKLGKAYLSCLDSTVRLIAMLIVGGLLFGSLQLSLKFFTDIGIRSSTVQILGIVLLVIFVPVIARLILLSGGFVQVKFPAKITPPGPPPSRKSLPSGR